LGVKKKHIDKSTKNIVPAKADLMMMYACSPVVKADLNIPHAPTLLSYTLVFIIIYLFIEILVLTLKSAYKPSNESH
jgi:hypothetical protein